MASSNENTTPTELKGEKQAKDSTSAEISPPVQPTEAPQQQSSSTVLPSRNATKVTPPQPAMPVAAPEAPKDPPAPASNTVKESKATSVRLKQEPEQDTKQEPVDSKGNDVYSSPSRTESMSDSEESLGIGPDDIVIAVMGVTGSGKSTFINSLSDEDVVVGKTMFSCTKKVSVHRSNISGPRKIWLIDTPGFDDTYIPDSDILAQIAYFLTSVYDSQILLTGIIYLHRIQDPRVGNAGLRNIRTIKALCGPDGLERTILVTTFWNGVTSEEGLERERYLLSESTLWNVIKQKDDKTFRCDRGNREHALKIIRHIIDLKLGKATLAIQTEMEKNLELKETGAGKEVADEIKQLRILFKEEIKLKESEVEEKKAELQKKEDELQKKEEELNSMRQEIDDVRNRLKKVEEGESILELKKDDLKKRFFGSRFPWIRGRRGGDKG